MEATLWSDYLCPWCYVGQARSAALRELGLTVTARPFELHPEIPSEGRRVRLDGRLAPTFERIEAECADAGLPFCRPTRVPNTHRALATAEVVRTGWPGAFPTLDASLFAAHFVTGDPLDDPDLLDRLVASAGAPSDDVRARVDSGEGSSLLRTSMDEAREAGVSATPTWVMGELTIPGAVPIEQMRRWASRMLARARQASKVSE